MSDLDKLALEMARQRQAFGYTYRRGDYNGAFAMIAPWVKGEMGVTAPNMFLAVLRDVSRYMPCHDHGNEPAMSERKTSKRRVLRAGRSVDGGMRTMLDVRDALRAANREIRAWERETAKSEKAEVVSERKTK